MRGNWNYLGEKARIERRNQDRETEWDQVRENKGIRVCDHQNTYSPPESGIQLWVSESQALAI